ncbi:GxxExxY protein [Chryseobacterium salivictor]|uniref:GxxExxY protein n=2 Tax=Chryseobacterium TaxID=59732 RepID=A0A4P6ZEU0_9FLAO|nr:GxxExxY protein [Chryseobacterium salivictor]QBO58103.1 hypothetical protein NBC122_01276 [Chryseobacterium salivictor]
MNENEISKVVFESGLKIHRKVGIGLYEAVYEECLVYELKRNGLKVEKQKDISIEDKVIIEIKAVPEIITYHTYQL